jgi:hypothetical protein
VGHVVARPHVDELLALGGAEVLADGEQVGQRLAVSSTVSPRPICMPVPPEVDKDSACAPSWCRPTSNEMRVRVDCLAKIIATDLPRRASV